MMGTSNSHTREMERTPPKMTSATNAEMTRPTTQVGRPSKLPHMMPVMAEDCTAEPVPRVAMAANRANATAPRPAHQGVEPSSRTKARFHAYMAPPIISPLWSFTRYLMEA